MQNINELLQQAQKMQEKIQDLQEKLAETEVVGQSGAGFVSITLNGKNEAKKIAIDPSLIKADEVEVLEDLLLAAFNDAKEKLESHMTDEMSNMSGMPFPPGMKLPF
ncbi:MAG: YbaB/EbfC family nucleoid-associated protein [Alphaproteobacteria bacterium]